MRIRGRPSPFPAGRTRPSCCGRPRRMGAMCMRYYVKTAFQPAFELEDARRLAGELDVPMTVIEADILAVPGGGGQRAGPVLPLQAAAVFRAVAAPPAATGTRVLAGRHQRLGRRGGPARYAGPAGAGGPLPPAGVRPDQGRSAAPVQGGGAVYLGQARLCLPGHPHPHRHAASQRRTWRGWSAAEDALFPPGVCRFPGAACGEDGARIQVTAAQMALASGKTGGNSGAAQAGFYGRPAGSNAAAGVPMRRELDGQ